MKEKIIKALDGIRTALQADGGDLEFVEVTADNVVKVKLKGACSCCPMAQVTLSQGVERSLKQAVPEVAGVEAV